MLPRCSKQVPAQSTSVLRISSKFWVVAWFNLFQTFFFLSLEGGSHFFGFSHQANEFWSHHSIDKGEFWQTNLNCHMKVRERITKTGSQIKTEFSQFGFPGIVPIFRNPILLQSHLSQSGCPKYSIKQFSFYVPNLLFFSFLSSETTL